MATVISTTFRLKRGLAARWQELNLVLDPGEPGFELDTYRLKIGDGKTAWNDLPYIGYNGAGGGDDGIIVDTVLSDTSLNPIANKTVKAAIDRVEALIEHYEFGDEFIVTEANGIKTVSIDLEALASLLPQVDTSNFATKEELRELAQTVSDLAAAIAQIKVPSKVSELENDAGYLTEHQDLSEYAKKTEIPSIEGLATETYVQQKIAEAELADGDVDLSLYYTKEEVDAKIPSIEGLASEKYVDSTFVQKKYEVLPIEGMFVKYGENEVRINTQRVVPTHQSVGAGGNSNMYYITFRAYAPEGARYSIESTGSATDTEPQILPQDDIGRYYSVIWTPIAYYENDSWSLYGDNSTVDKYLGFNYTFTWYAEDKITILGIDKVRIILTNDACHNELVEEPTARYIDDKINTIETTLENNYITIDQGVTKDVLNEVVEEKVAEVVAGGVSVDKIEYGTF